MVMSGFISKYLLKGIDGNNYIKHAVEQVNQWAI